jgi:hypothetical protein
MAVEAVQIILHLLVRRAGFADLDAALCPVRDAPDIFGPHHFESTKSLYDPPQAALHDKGGIAPGDSVQHNPFDDYVAIGVMLGQEQTGSCARQVVTAFDDNAMIPQSSDAYQADATGEGVFALDGKICRPFGHESQNGLGTKNRPGAGPLK